MHKGDVAKDLAFLLAVHELMNDVGAVFQKTGLVESQSDILLPATVLQDWCQGRGFEPHSQFTQQGLYRSIEPHTNTMTAWEYAGKAQRKHQFLTGIIAKRKLH